MIATTHLVSPEEVMAFVDGELSSAEAATVSAHIAECAECASMAAQFRETSESVARWTVPAVPESLDASVAQLIAKAGNENPTSKPIRSILFGGRHWTVAQLGTIAAVLLLFTAGLTMHYSSPTARLSDRAQSVDRNGLFVEPRNSAGDSVSRPQAAPLPSPAMQSMSGIEADRLVQLPPGVVAGNLSESRSRAQQAATKGSGLPNAFANQGASQPTPMIAHSVSLTVQVRDLGASRAALDALLSRHRGYAAQLTVNTAEGLPRSLQGSLRVPDGELAAAIAEMRALGRVEMETQSGEEVTQQHADLVARLENARETEQRLRELLAQRTGKIDEVLQVEEEIDRVRGEIEQMEAEQKILEHRVDFATVELRLAEQYREQLGAPSASVSVQIGNAFVAGLRHGENTLVGVLLFVEEAGPTALIWLAILAVPGILLWRRYRRMLNQR